MDCVWNPIIKKRNRAKRFSGFTLVGLGLRGGAKIRFEKMPTSATANAGSDAEFGAMTRSLLGKRDRIRPYA